MTTPETNVELHGHTIVSKADWIVARKELLREEKEFTRLRDEISRQRRALPWVRVEKQYVFDSPNGRVTLADLFGGRSQLIVKHFMFAPGWREGCSGCSFDVDHIEAALVHLEHHDVSCVAVSRATLPEIEAFKRRMGWRMPWVSSFGSDFNYDFHASFTEDEIAKRMGYYNYELQEVPISDVSGFSVFFKEEAGGLFHTYSTFARGSEEVATTYVCLDMTPKGRNENGPYHDLRDWLRHHDRYEDLNYNFMSAYEPAGSGCCSSEARP